MFVAYHSLLLDIKEDTLYYRHPAAGIESAPI